MSKKRRIGSGSVIVIVVLLLFIIAAVTMGRSFFTSYVSDRTTKSVYGDTAFQIASNILKEAQLISASLSNTSGTPVFDSWRGDDVLFSTEISLDELPASKSMIESFKGYDLPYDGFALNVLSRKPSSEVIPFLHDSYGLLELQSTVRHTSTGTIRSQSSIFEYRTTLTAPPVPLAGFTVLIGDGVFLQNAYGIDNDANKTIDGSIARIEELFDEVSQSITKGIDIKNELESKADSALPPLDDAYEDAAGTVGESIQILQNTLSLKPSITVSDFGTNTKGTPDALHYFSPPPVCYYSKEQQVDLKDLNLPDKVKNRLTQIESSEKILYEEAQKLKQFLDSSPQNIDPLKPLIQNLCTATLNCSKTYEDLLLKDYKGFQDIVEEAGGTDFTDFLEVFKQLSKKDLLRKATAIITESDDGTGRDINQKFNDFLSRYERFNGLIFVGNSSTELEINHTFNGRVFIVSEKDVVIKKALKTNDSKDLVTIASFGKMTLEGPAEASLIPWHTFSCVPSVPLKGNILFSRLSFVSGSPEEVLGATITYDPFLDEASGSDEQAFKKYEYVTISPAILATGVERK